MRNDSRDPDFSDGIAGILRWMNPESLHMKKWKSQIWFTLSQETISQKMVANRLDRSIHSRFIHEYPSAILPIRSVVLNSRHRAASGSMLIKRWANFFACLATIPWITLLRF
jgi:hypothetical protein